MKGLLVCSALSSKFISRLSPRVIPLSRCRAVVRMLDSVRRREIKEKKGGKEEREWERTVGRGRRAGKGEKKRKISVSWNIGARGVPRRNVPRCYMCARARELALLYFSPRARYICRRLSALVRRARTFIFGSALCVERPPPPVKPACPRAELIFARFASRGDKKKKTTWRAG